MRFHVAELLILLIILLDASVTISGINQYTDFFANPMQAIQFEGNPFVQTLLSFGLPLLLLSVIGWAGLAIYLYNEKNPFRFFIFGGFFSLHFLGYLSWFLRIGFVDFNQFLYWVAFLALLTGLVVSMNKSYSKFLDRTVVI